MLSFYAQEDYAATVFRIQLSVEQLQKSVLLFLGIQFRKTHEPSRVIDSVIYDSDVELDEEIVENLKNLSRIAKIIEKEETTTRYGIERDDEIIPPEEIYDKKKTRHFLKSLIDILCIVASLIEEFPSLEKPFEELKIFAKKMEVLLDEGVSE